MNNKSTASPPHPTQKFLVLNSGSPQELDRQLNKLAETQRVAIINSNISE